MGKRTTYRQKNTKNKAQRFLDPENWRAPSKQELIKHYEAKSKSEKGISSVISFRKHLSPVDVYTYLKARFGEPNGFLNFMKSSSSDNLIHWEYLLVCENVAINIMGMHRAVDIILQGEITDDEWKILLKNLRNAYPKHAKEKSKVLKSLEEWSVFINRYSELCSEAAIHHDKITELQDFQFKMPPIPSEDGITNEWQENFQQQAASFHELQQACLALKLVTPILLESFINLLILIMCKKEIRENQTIYAARVREDLHIKIPSLHLTCAHFSKAVDTESDEYKNFSRIMNNRNWFFHGNTDPKKDKLETVYFEGNTPLYKTPGNVHEKFFSTLLNMIQPKAILEDYLKAHEFIVYVVNCIKQEHREYVWRTLESNSLGYNEKEKRFGVLFPDFLVSSHLPGIKTDETLF